MSTDESTNLNRRNLHNETNEKRKTSDISREIKDNVKTTIKRMSWKKYLVQTSKKILIGIFVLLLFLILYYYSHKISMNATSDNVPDVIGYFTTDYLILIVVSSTLFLLVLGAFIKTLFIDHREEFGLHDFKTKRVIFLFLLVVSFISAVYTLLDVAIQNVYMVIGPVDFIWIINKYIIPLPTIDSSTDLLAYAKIRTYYFFSFYLFMLIFPIIMFLTLLTRYGRRKVFQKQDVKEVKKSGENLTAPIIIFTPIIVYFLINLINSSVMKEGVKFIITSITLALILWWSFLVLKLIVKGIKLTALFSYDNTIIFFPLIFLFYILPIILWTGWDLFMIISMKGSTVKTSLTELHTPLANTVLNLSSLSIQDKFGIILQIILVNAFYLIRIIQLDFVFVVAISALAIGFAEGYSIIAIFSALFKGVSVARTGKIASQSAPKLVVMTSRIIMLGAWLSFFWDRIVIMVGVMKTYFIVYFPFLKNVKLPRIFELFVELKVDINLSFLGILIPLSLLLIPLYYILMSGFKFLSVSLLVDRTKNDQQTFFLLISAAFVLITTNILQDITASIPSYSQYLPTSYATAQFLISFANKIFEFLESSAFYIGVLVAVFITLKKLLRKLKKHSKEKEIENREHYYSLLSGIND